MRALYCWCQYKLKSKEKTPPEGSLVRSMLFIGLQLLGVVYAIHWSLRLLFVFSLLEFANITIASGTNAVSKNMICDLTQNSAENNKFCFNPFARNHELIILSVLVKCCYVLNIKCNLLSPV